MPSYVIVVCYRPMLIRFVSSIYPDKKVMFVKIKIGEDRTCLCSVPEMHDGNVWPETLDIHTCNNVNIRSISDSDNISDVTQFL